MKCASRWTDPHPHDPQVGSLARVEARLTPRVAEAFKCISSGSWGENHEMSFTTFLLFPAAIELGKQLCHQFSEVCARKFSLYKTPL